MDGIVNGTRFGLEISYVPFEGVQKYAAEL